MRHDGFSTTHRNRSEAADAVATTCKSWARGGNLASPQSQARILARGVKYPQRAHRCTSSSFAHPPWPPHLPELNSSSNSTPASTSGALSPKWRALSRMRRRRRHWLRLLRPPPDLDLSQRRRRCPWVHRRPLPLLPWLRVGSLLLPQLRRRLQPPLQPFPSHPSRRPAQRLRRNLPPMRMTTPRKRKRLETWVPGTGCHQL